MFNKYDFYATLSIILFLLMMLIFANIPSPTQLLFSLKFIIVIQITIIYLYLLNYLLKKGEKR